MTLILFRYIAKKNIFYLLSIICGLSFVILIFDFIELLKLLYKQEISLFLILKLAILKNYFHLEKILPLIFIISTITTYLNLSKYSELIVARSYGMSIWQFTAPAVAVAFIYSIINIFLLNPISSSLVRKYEKLEAIHLKGHISKVVISSNGIWFKQSNENGNIIIHALRISQQNKELYEVTYFNTNKDYNFLSRIHASSARFKNKTWELRNVNITDENYTFTYYDSYILPANIDFSQIQEKVVSPNTMSVYKLPYFIQSSQQSGFSVLRHLSYFYKIIISPFWHISMVFMIITFVVKPNRVEKEKSFLFIGICLGFLIYFLSDIIIIMGITGNIPILFSTIIPTVICLMIGVYLVLHYEDS